MTRPQFVLGTAALFGVILGVAPGQQAVPEDAPKQAALKREPAKPLDKAALADLEKCYQDRLRVKTICVRNFHIGSAVQTGYILSWQCDGSSTIPSLANTQIDRVVQGMRIALRRKNSDFFGQTPIQSPESENVICGRVLLRHRRIRSNRSGFACQSVPRSGRRTSPSSSCCTVATILSNRPNSSPNSPTRSGLHRTTRCRLEVFGRGNERFPLGRRNRRVRGDRLLPILVTTVCIYHWLYGNTLHLPFVSRSSAASRWAGRGRGTWGCITPTDGAPSNPARASPQRTDTRTACPKN